VTWRAFLQLSRASNLPTVLSNALAGAVLGGAVLAPGSLARVGLALSACYVGGTFLNDAFDRSWDAVRRPERPIPRGDASLGQVFLTGGWLLLFGAVLLARAPGAAVCAIALATAIVVYDRWHKTVAAAPLLMGACRALAVVGAGLSAGGHCTASLLVAAAVLLGYVALLSLWSRIGGRYVGELVAGISLVDAGALWWCGHRPAAVAAIACFAFSLRLQRYLSGD
jgi:4-hydroxybenzoate polyprenyltransferase